MDFGTLLGTLGDHFGGHFGTCSAKRDLFEALFSDMCSDSENERKWRSRGGLHMQSAHAGAVQTRFSLFRLGPQKVSTKPLLASFLSSSLRVFAKKGAKKGGQKPSKKVGLVLGRYKVLQGTTSTTSTSHLRQNPQNAQRQREDATTVPGLESRRVFCTFQNPPDYLATSEITCENSKHFKTRQII